MVDCVLSFIRNRMVAIVLNFHMSLGGCRVKVMMSNASYVFAIS
jgi:hypothetical protein